MSTLPTSEEENTPFDDVTDWAGNLKEETNDETEEADRGIFAKQSVQKPKR